MSIDKHSEQIIDGPESSQLTEQLREMVEVEKPELLYHASSQRGIQEFEPRAEKTRDPLEGPVVFATPDKAYASLFLVPSDDSWTQKGRFSSEGEEPEPWHIVISDPARYKKLDHGGAIYSFDPESFTTDPDRNMHGAEWTSSTSVAPISSEEYASALEAMREQGVNIYFVDEETFRQIRDSDDHGRAIIHSLKPTTEF